MHANLATSAAPPKRRRKWPKRFAIAFALVVLLATGIILFLWFMADHELAAAIAEADRLDPCWRFAELEEKRAKIADTDNAALHIIATEKLLPTAWPSWQGAPFKDRDDLANKLATLPPTAQLTAVQVTTLAEVRTAADKALVEARKLKDLPQGRYPIVLDKDGLPISVVRGARCADLLHYDILVCAEEQDLDGAIESCRAYVNVARAYGDDPRHHIQIQRMAMRREACRIVERALAQGVPSEADLAALQKLLEDEEPQPLFLHGARGLRAHLDAMLEGVHSGRIKQNEMPSAVASALAVHLRPATLRMTTRLVEAAKRPVEEQQQALEQGGSPRDDEGSYLVREFMLPKIRLHEYHVGSGQIRTQAELRCVIVAIAAERYRLAHGQWPAAPAALVPDLLSKVPIDPFDRQPVRYHKLLDGLVIYCVGPDRIDDGGRLARGPNATAGTDVGVRLWDVEARRQPAPAAVKAADD
jgi:hypothetical protein